jgi:hypothetical protein
MKTEKMYIEKFKAEDGYYYYDIDGAAYDNVKDFILNGIFGFCGCGLPEKVILYIRDALQLMYDRKEEEEYIVRMDIKENLEQSSIRYAEWNKKAKELFKSDSAEQLMWYVLDKADLLEHGGCVPGWITNEGIGLLGDLNELIKTFK